MQKLESGVLHAGYKCSGANRKKQKLSTETHSVCNHMKSTLYKTRDARFPTLLASTGDTPPTPSPSSDAVVSTFGDPRSRSDAVECLDLLLYKEIRALGIQTERLPKFDFVAAPTLTRDVSDSFISFLFSRMTRQMNTTIPVHNTFRNLFKHFLDGGSFDNFTNSSCVFARSKAKCSLLMAMERKGHKLSAELKDNLLACTSMHLPHGIPKTTEEAIKEVIDLNMGDKDFLQCHIDKISRYWERIAEMAHEHASVKRIEPSCDIVFLGKLSGGVEPFTKTVSVVKDFIEEKYRNLLTDSIYDENMPDSVLFDNFQSDGTSFESFSHCHADDCGMCRCIDLVKRGFNKLFIKAVYHVANIYCKSISAFLDSALENQETLTEELIEYWKDRNEHRNLTTGTQLVVARTQESVGKTVTLWFRSMLKPHTSLHDLIHMCSDLVDRSDRLSKDFPDNYSINPILYSSMLLSLYEVNTVFYHPCDCSLFDRDIRGINNLVVGASINNLVVGTSLQTLTSSEYKWLNELNPIREKSSSSTSSGVFCLDRLFVFEESVAKSLTNLHCRLLILKVAVDNELDVSLIPNIKRCISALNVVAIHCDPSRSITVGEIGSIVGHYTSTSVEGEYSFKLICNQEASKDSIKKLGGILLEYINTFEWITKGVAIRCFGGSSSISNIVLDATCTDGETGEEGNKKRTRRNSQFSDTGSSASLGVLFTKRTQFKIQNWTGYGLVSQKSYTNNTGQTHDQYDGMIGSCTQLIKNFIEERLSGSGEPSSHSVKLDVAVVDPELSPIEVGIGYLAHMPTWPVPKIVEQNSGDSGFIYADFVLGSVQLPPILSIPMSTTSVHITKHNAEAKSPTTVTIPPSNCGNRTLLVNCDDSADTPCTLHDTFTDSKLDQK